MHNILLFGPQGSGKGTQGTLLTEDLNLPLIVTGNIFRENMKNQTELGVLAQGYINEGNLVPDEVTNEMIRAELAKPEYVDGFILDGFPRSLAQADALDTITTITHLLHIFITDDEAVTRIMKRKEIEGRADDTAEALQKRLEIYHSETEPLLDHYRTLGVAHDINGEQSVEKVSQDIKELFRN